MIDVSFLGISVPFEVFEINDDKVACTVGAIERALTSHGIGGIKRYESDNYIGGNPWILTTLWVALYYAKRKDFLKAREYFDWAVKSRTELDLLPEQVNKDTGKPEWVIPLTWSHAMFVLVLWELVEAGVVVDGRKA
jgi:glucoamylase